MLAATWFQIGFIVAWVALGLITGAHAVMYKRDSKGAALWVLLNFMLPIVGPWLYWVLGINRMKRPSFRRRARKKHRQRARTHVTAAARIGAAKLPSAELEPLRVIAERVTGLPLLPGNQIVPLHNGEQAYPEMLSAISGAKRNVTFANYIFDCDDVGKEFASTLGDAARRGVAVHLLMDGIGAVGHYSRIGRLLLKSGARVVSFFPLRFPLGRIRINLRNHRKLLVIDGEVGFTGGMNVSHRHSLRQKGANRVEDLHFQVAGPVVADMQQIFCEDWFLATGEALTSEAYFPVLHDAGSSMARVIASGPDENIEKFHLIAQAAFATAQRSVRVVTPYFVPSSALIAAMVMAALRGVEVTMILPSVTDIRFMRWAADAYLWELLQHGVRVFRRRPPFVHTKLMVVDDRWILLGSANLDRRSLRLNFEFNIEAYDAELGRSLGEWFDALLPRSKEVTFKAIEARPPLHRLRDGFVKLFSPHL